MAWQRKIPFGYTMKKGEIQCSPTESAAVLDILRVFEVLIVYIFLVIVFMFDFGRCASKSAAIS